MSFRRYSEYKESRIDWAGSIPLHWRASRLRWYCRRFAGGTPDKNNPDYWTDGTIPWLNSGAVNDPIITQPSAYITEDAYENSSAKWIPPGALVVALAGQGRTKGTVAQVAFRVTCNQSMAALVPEHGLQPRYLYWWLTSNYQNIRNMSGGDLREGLNLELLGDIACPLPTAQEQAAIASFLDRETGKIDALVAEQEKLIDLLKEKRQAVISHAVTKGLNPDAPMKPSGVEWLGDVPAHWNVAPIKRIARMESGHTPDKKIPAYWEGGDIDWVSLNDTGYLKDNDYISETAFRITQAGVDNSSARLLPAGAVVFSRDATIGRCAITTKPMTVSQHFIAWVCPESLLPDFLLHAFRAMSQELERRATGATVKTIGMPDVRELAAAFPPVEEQRVIVKHIQTARSSIDSLTAEAEAAIALLKERRSALICAAVTGQIDVRALAT